MLRNLKDKVCLTESLSLKNGAIIGSLLTATVIVCLVLFLIRNKKKRSAKEEAEQNEPGYVSGPSGEGRSDDILLFVQQ